MRRIGVNAVGRIFTTGEELSVILKNVDRNMNETDDDFTRALQHKKITVGEFDRNLTLQKDWHAFYLDQTNRSFVDPITASAVADEADSYDKERAILREWLSKKAPDETPGPTPPLVTPPEAPPGIPWGLISGAVGLVALVYLAGPFIRGVGARVTEKRAPAQGWKQTK